MGAPDPQVTDKPLVATLAMTPELAANLSTEAGALVEAQGYVIDSPEMAQAANRALQDIKRRLTLVDQWYERFTLPLKQLKETADSFFGPPRTALKQAETHLKAALQGWQEKELKRIADQRREQEEIARKAREQAERDAAAARARAEQAAAEARRRAQAEEEARRKAEAEGNVRAAREAAARKAKAEEEERQRIAEAERKAAEAQLAAAAQAPTVTVAEPTKLDGFSQRKNWIAEFPLGGTPEQALEKIVAAIAGVPAISGRRDLLALISLDMKHANKLAKALESNFSVPGLIARNAPVAASRG